jgi:hypothetical protein
MEVASNAQKLDSPLMEQTWTVVFWSSFDLALPKQLEYERNEDQHKKNLRN